MLSAPLLRFRLLGAAQVFGPDGCDLRLGSAKGRALLCFLAATAGKSHSRQKLADLLWGERGDSHARQSLRQSLMTLRRELGTAAPALIVSDQGAELDHRLILVDSQQFSALSLDPVLDQRRRCLDLPWGVFLEGLEASSEAFDEWMTGERNRLENEAVRVFSELADRLDANADEAGCLAAIERLVSIDPSEEEWHRKWLRMEAKYRGVDAAVARAKQLKAYLARELDVALSARTLALLETIRHEGSVAAAGEKVAIAPARPQVVAPAAPPEQPPASGASDLVAPENPPDDFHVEVDKKALRPEFKAGRIAIAAALAAICIAVGGGALIASRASKAPAPVGPKAADPAWHSPARVGERASPQAREAVAALIVLPFTPEGNGSSEAFADLLTGELINLLSHSRNLRVISRGTSATFRGVAVDPSRLKQELGVHLLVEGRVERTQEHARVSVELVDTASRAAIWSDRFQADVKQPDKTAAEIAMRITRALHMETIQFEAARLGGRGDVQEMLARGWAIMFRATRSPHLLEEAKQAFAQALQAAPDNTLAMTGLAATYVTMVAEWQTAQPASLLTEAEQLIQKALERNPNVYPTQFYAGLLFKLQQKNGAAISAFERALDLNPSSAGAHAQIGNVLLTEGRPHEALEHIRYALRLAPKDRGSAIWYRFAGEAELEIGRTQEAIRNLQRSIELSPSALRAWIGLAAAQALSGLEAEARESLEHARKLAESRVGFALERVLPRHVSLVKARPRYAEGLRLALRASGTAER